FGKEAAAHIVERDRRVLAGEVIEEEHAKNVGDSVHSFHVVKVPMRDVGGEIVGLCGIARDITERKSAEATIVAQKDFLSSVIESLTHPFCVIDAHDHTIKLVNRAARQQGMEMGSTCHMCFHGRATPCDGSDYPCPIEQVTSTGGPVTLEHVHTDPEGTPRHCEVHGYPVFDHDGNVEQIIEYVLDITERNQAEEALRRRNRELSLLNWVIGAAASGMNEKEILGTACTELGLALEVDRVGAVLEEEGKNRVRVVAEHVGDGLLPMLGESVEIAPEDAYRAVLGERRPIASADVIADPRFEALRPVFAHFGIVSLLLVPLIIEDRVGGVLGLACTKRRDFLDDELGLSLSVAGQLSSSLALAKVNATRRRLQAAIEQTENSVVITDTAGNIVYVNPGFERLTGYRKGEALGENPRVLKSGRQDEAFYEELWSTITRGRIWRGRIVNKKKDGALFTEDAVITPVRAEDGTITNFVAVKRDVTREIELEEQFLQAQKMEGIGRLAGGIAHDFNNLLGVIMGYAELGQAQLEEGSPIHELFGEMISASDQAARLTRQLLIFARNQPSEVSNISVNDIVLGVKRVFQWLIGEDIVIETNLEKNLACVRVNPSQFEQVLLNLGVNARDAMPTGGRIMIETSTTYIEALASSHQGDMSSGRYVVLSVTDTGIGMPAEIRDQIFEPFFSTKERTRATGLGLSTCYGIVTQAGGQITVDTLEGRGTTIRVFLPACKPDDQEERILPLDQDASVAGGAETILLAEDDRAVRMLAAGTLRKLGYRVLEAIDGEDALTQVASHDGTIDLLVTDVVMPRLRGPDLAASLLQAFPDIKVVFISGYSEDPLVLEDFGDAVLVQKPFKTMALACTIREILDR
ncbi:MAG: PAS domain S-box protein, partial [Thermoanaerobaculales bacterium]|nr:PAS domain S-box protein [Thermoanaerobaculales bacterium]